MNRSLTISRFLYSQMIPWYPPRLRAEYGPDMMEAFT